MRGGLAVLVVRGYDDIREADIFQNQLEFLNAVPPQTQPLQLGLKQSTLAPFLILEIGALVLVLDIGHRPRPLQGNRVPVRHGKDRGSAEHTKVEIRVRQEEIQDQPAARLKMVVQPF